MSKMKFFISLIADELESLQIEKNICYDEERLKQIDFLIEKFDNLYIGMNEILNLKNDD